MFGYAVDGGNCELLVGHCDQGRKLLEAVYMNRRYSGTATEGLISAQVSRLCPVTSFPTVEKRVMAVSLQAGTASGSSENQSKWCGALERTLLADTKSAEAQACFAEFAGLKPTKPCGLLISNLREAYRHLAECFLRDKNCREGARLDVMHTQLEVIVVSPDDPRVARWCQPSRAMEMYPACSAAGEEAQRQCMERIEAADRAGIEKLTPEVLPR